MKKWLAWLRPPWTARDQDWRAALFERHPHPMAIYDPETLRFLAVNNAAVECYGYSRGEFLNMALPALRFPDDPTDLRQALRETASGLHRRGVVRHRRKNGAPVDMQISTQDIPFQGRSAVLAIAEDVSERLRAEDMVHAMVESSPLGLMVTDPEGRILKWNASAERIFGWTAQEAIGSRLPAPPEDEATLDILREKVRRGGTLSGLEMRHVRKDGSAVDIRFSSAPLKDGLGEVRGVLSVIEDIGTEVQAQQSLLRSDRRFHELADAMPLMVWTAAADGRLEYANKAFTKYTGIPSDEMLGDRWTDAVHPDGLKEGLESWNRAVRERKPHSQELLFFRASDRTYRWHLLRAEPVRDESGKVVKWYGTATEIHESRKMQRRLTTLLDNLPGMAYRSRLDLDWTMLFVSQGSTALTGYAPEDLVLNARVAFGDLVHPEDQGRIRDEVMEAVNEGRPFELEYRIRTRDGKIRCVWERGRFFPNPSGGKIEGFIMDVTARKLAEDERERLLAAIEQMGEMMLITDARGAIQYVNPAFERVTGYKRAEVRGRNPRILKSGAQDAAFYLDMWKTLLSGQTWRGRLVNKRKDGTRFTEEALISPVFDEAGKIVSYVGVKNDISSRLALEDQVRQAQKMEAVGRLAGGIAHDFNNMLTVILMRSEMGLLKAEEGHPLRPLLREIHEAAERSAALTRQLLTYARRQAVEPRVIDPNVVVEGTLQMLKRLMGENIQLEWLPGDSVWPVKIDPVQVDQLLANLCVNARDAIEDVGTVTIETLNVTLTPEDCRDKPGHVPGRFVRVAVSDTGSGMDPDVLAHLFEPFFTTKEVGKGTGLGLATVYGIVKQNNGFVDVYSEPGDGTVFKIYLPRHAEGPSAEPPKTAREIPRARGETILLVEDEPLILNATAEILQDLGYRVIACGGPAEALERMRGPGESIDMMLTDVIMPGMNGRDLLVRLREERPGLKVLFMSGYTANVVVHRGIADGVESFIQKPFTAEALAAKVRRVLEAPVLPA